MSSPPFYWRTPFLNGRFPLLMKGSFCFLSAPPNPNSIPLTMSLPSHPLLPLIQIHKTSSFTGSVSSFTGSVSTERPPPEPPPHVKQIFYFGAPDLPSPSILRFVTAPCPPSLSSLVRPPRKPPDKFRIDLKADMVPVGKRASAFGILAGVGSASFVGGTLAARFLSAALTFQVASVSSMIGLVYMRIFLKESAPMRQPLLKEAEEPCIQQCEDDLPQRTFKKLPSMGDLICLLKCSPTFSQAAIVLLFNSLADGGSMAVTLYYLKARFQYNKNQFADLMMISGIGATLTQLFLMPILVPAVGEEKLLTTGLFVSCISMLMYSISWSAWVPYALAGFSVLGVLVRPSLTSIASKQVGPNEQGMVQGCLSGITSAANIISPLIFSPLTALFLSEDAPFNFPGFSLMCLGLTLMTACFLSLMIRAPPPIVGDKVSSNHCTETLV